MLSVEGKFEVREVIVMIEGKRILVTGANGFIGRWVRKSLEEKNKVIGISMSGHVGEGEMLKGDISTIASIPPVDYCIHLAAISDVEECEKNPLRAMEVNVAGTLNILRLCSEVGVKGVIIASSGKVYGECSGQETVSEEKVVNPYNVYGFTKAQADYISLGFSSIHNLPVVSARLVNVYGPGDASATRIIPSTIQAIKRGEQPIIYGDGSVKRTFIHISDVMNFFQCVLQGFDRGMKGGVFNVSTDQKYTMKQIIGKIIELMGSDIQPKYLKGGKAKSDYILKSDKAQSWGWKPLIALEEGLKEMIGET